MTVRVSLLGSYGQGSGVRCKHLMPACLPVHTLYTHPTAADAGCQGNQTDNQPDNLEPTGCIYLYEPKQCSLIHIAVQGATQSHRMRLAIDPGPLDCRYSRICRALGLD
eukprot:4412986-Pyramimonas_sp.AAC.1